MIDIDVCFVGRKTICLTSALMEVRKFILFCDEIIRVCEDDTKVGWFESYYSRVAVAFIEKWQKLILTDLIIPKQSKNSRWPDFEKYIKQSFGLESKEEI